MHFTEIYNVYREFIKRNSDQEITIFCPYIQLQPLKSILVDKPSKLSVVTTWKTLDILNGVSEIEIYPFLKEIKSSLYINQKIHLKVITNYEDAVIGSANITNAGLGLHNSNYECVCNYEKVDRNQQVFLRSIIRESALINDDDFNKINKLIEHQRSERGPVPKYNDIDFTGAVNKEFLISALPMSISIDTFFDYYSEKLESHGFADADYNCAMHDLANYKIPLNLNRQTFNKYLKKAFFGQPFIQDLKGFICKPRYFGEIKEWVQKTCVDVPVPSRRDLTGNVQVLYRWFYELGGDEFVVDRPSHSERISPRVMVAVKKR